jgi:hypothetical protein
MAHLRLCGKYDLAGLNLIRVFQFGLPEFGGLKNGGLLILAWLAMDPVEWRENLRGGMRNEDGKKRRI